jgi:hypothetical protein
MILLKNHLKKIKEENLRAYSIKTNNTWFYSISWTNFPNHVLEIDCFDREKPRNASRLSDVEFSLDKTYLEDLEKTKIGFM